MFFLSIFFGLVGNGNASISIRATPFDGGNSLRFGRISTTTTLEQEVRIRITSTDNQQYQVFQRVVEPFYNERGESISPFALQSYTISGSNSTGTLYQQDKSPLGNINQLIYTSNSSGLSDSFIVVYALDPKEIHASGSFFGRIRYLLQPIGGGSQKEAYLDVYFEIPDELRVTAKTSRGVDLIQLDPQKPNSQEDYYQIHFSGNFGGLIEIFQEPEIYPVNEQNIDLGEKVVSFMVSGGNEGIVEYQSATPLSRKRIRIYSSKENEDTIYVHFRLNKEEAERQQAGLYSGKINYMIEGNRQQTIKPLSFQVKINPIFELKVDYPTDGMSFRNVLPDSAPQTKETTVWVKSNMGRPYMVVQKVSAPLTNEKGETFKRENFLFKVVPLTEEYGKLSFQDFQPVPVGDVPIFFSDAKGSPAGFKIIYKLNPYQKMPPGNYTTSIDVTLGEL